MASGFWTIPNSLTISRIAITLALHPTLYFDHRGWFLAGYLAAALTDVLDGYLARRLHLTSYLGMRLDSFADWLLIASSVVWAYVLMPALFQDHQAVWMTMVL